MLARAFSIGSLRRWPGDTGRASALGVLLALATWAVCGTARGYVQTTDPSGRRVAWREANFSIRVAGAPPRGVTKEAVLRAARAAAATWNSVHGSAVRVVISPGSGGPYPAVEEDHSNLIVTHTIAWCADERGHSCHSSLNPALTSVRFRQDRAVHEERRPQAEIYEVDIELNDVDYRWDDLSRANAADLQVVLTHELGHALGLADACRMPGGRAIANDVGRPAPDCTAAPPDVQASVMWPLGQPNDLRRRKLSDEDRRAICALYPTKGLRQP